MIRASIMQCQDVIIGRMHFSETGELVFLTAAGDLLGRGYGIWVCEEQVIGFQLDVFQYEASSTKHVQAEPHRFRGIAVIPEKKGSWLGEWYFLSSQSPPRLVGKFHACRSTGSLILPALSSKPLPDLPNAKSKVIERLDKLLEPLPMMQPSWVPHHLPGNISNIYYVRNFLEPKQVEEFERIIDKTCDWERMSTRDTQEFGSSGMCPCGRSLMRVALPPWQATMVDALSTLGVFHSVLFPANSVRLNSYRPGQGIFPHLDGPVYYPRVAIVSLGTQCVFDFYPRMDTDLDEDQRGFSWDRDKEVPASPDLPPGTKPELSLLLEPGSLLVFDEDAFVYNRHGIASVDEDEIGPQVKNAADIGLSPGDTLKRGKKRVSLTIRHLLPRCGCNTLL